MGLSEKKIDFKAIGKTAILADGGEDEINVDMNEQSHIVHAALTAIQATNIPNSNVYVDKDDNGNIYIKKSSVAYVQGEEGSELRMPDRGITLKNTGLHVIDTNITIMPQEDGTTLMTMSAHHAGSYGNKIDASTASVTYSIDKDGHFTGRSGGAHTEERGGSVRDQEHGQWAIQAAQALEHSLGKILGGTTETEISAQRSPEAATSVGAPPTTTDSVSLDKIDFNALGAKMEPLVKPAAMNF